jgi:hypothetical protein
VYLDCQTNPSKYSITLNPAEERLARYLAEARTQANRRRSAVDPIRGPQSASESELEGVAAELAFCRLFNVYPDLTVGDPDKGFDCILSGKTVDVKATKYSNGMLICVEWKTKVPDYFALMTGTIPTYEFRGFMAGAELIHECRLKNHFNRGLVYAAQQSELRLSTERGHSLHESVTQMEWEEVRSQ